MLINMAWRNLWRSKRRTIITVISIAFGLLLSITFTSLSDGSYIGYIDSAARSGAGHVTLEPEAFRDNPSADKTLSNTKQLLEQLRSHQGVTGAVERVVGQAMVATAADNVGVSYYAIKPEDEQGALFALNHIKEGENLAGTKGRGVLIGAGMAEQLDVKIGSKMVVTTTDRKGEVVSNLARVKGIFKTGMEEVDRYIIILPIDTMRSLLGYGENEANQIAVFVDDQRSSGRLAEDLQAMVIEQGGVARPWYEQMPEVAGMISMDKGSNYIFQIFVFLLIAAGILNTLLMGVLERMREIGVMLAVGISPGRLFALVLTESFWLAIVGLIAGLVISAPIYHYLHTTGLDMSAMIKEGTSFSGAVFDPIMKSQMYLDKLAIILGGVFSLVMLAGMYPAWVATRINPIKALQNL